MHNRESVMLLDKGATMESVGSRPSPAVESDFSVTVHSTVSQFDALEQRWNHLVEEANATIFQSFEWQRTWWKHYGERNPSSTLHIVTIERSGRLLAIAPFFIESQRRAGILRTRQLSFIAKEATDYLDLIVARGHEEECIGVLSLHIAECAGSFDFLHLIDMPERLGHHALLYKELERFGFRGDHFVNEHCPRTKLLHTWEATLASFPSSKRASIKRVQKKITADFSVELETVTDPSGLTDGFVEFVNLHQRRWNDIGHMGVFADKRAESFHAEMVGISRKRGWLFLGFLLLNGERKAGIYGFIYHKEFFFYLSGIDLQENLEKYSIGRVLHLYTMLEVTKMGVEVYDFMRGTERYKYDLNGVDADNWTIVAYPASNRLAGLKFKAAMLVDSFSRRFSKERFLWRQSLKEKKLFSRATRDFVAGRLSTNLKDGILKLKAPAKSLTIQEDQKS